MSEHTPGPFKFFKSDIDQNYYITTSEAEADCAYVGLVYRANDAHLIAAAPEMLEMLKQFQKRSVSPMFTQLIENLINKAEGKEKS
jgi:hypothetical protein